MEIINNQLAWWLEHDNKTSNTQFGFRHNRSCLDNLAIFTLDVLKAFGERNRVAVLFLDIQNEYDNVSIDVLVDTIKQIGLLGHLLAFIFNLTSERELFVRYGELQCSGFTYRGLSQCSVISPALYALYTSELKEVINSECRILEFADSVAICTVNRRHRMGVACVEENAEAIKECLGLKGLEIAPNKCQLCVFDKKRTKAGESEINLGDTAIRSVQSVKFLGLHIATNLNWEKQVESVSKNARTH
jgi:hypothetical protein